MARIPLKSILWRWCNQATFDTLHGTSPGQYDIRLSTNPQIGEFVEGLPSEDQTAHGGYTVHVPIEPFEGDPPVEAQPLTIRYMGPRSKRGDWYIRAQRPATAYPLWRPGRGCPNLFDPAAREYAMLIRDHRDCFHARWISHDAFDSLPTWVQEALASDAVGIRRYA